MTTKKQQRPEWVVVPVEDLPWEVEALVRPVGERPEIVGLWLRPRLEAGEFWPEDFVISSDRLRSLPLRRIKEEAARARRDDLTTAIRVDEPGPDGRWAEGHFRIVASAYEVAVDAGLAPLPFIQDLWSVSRTAASRWVRIARERGHLGYPDKRGVAGVTADRSPHVEARRIEEPAASERPRSSD